MSGEKFIDLRSDTVTRPTAEMRKAMFEAVVGDDVYGEDPTINALQEKAARLLGKEAALFVASGTMGNQLSIKAHTQPGDEVIIAAGGHAMNFEGGSSAVLSGIQFAPIPVDRGIFDAGQVEAAIRPAGLWKQKARVLQETLNVLFRERGQLDLSHLTDLTDSEIIEYLTGLRGVGVKTAACVLCFSLGRPYMPVDTHVHRVARRLGLIPARATAEQAHELLNRDGSVPRELRFSFHIQLIRHGRAICRAGRPACDRCVLEDLCPKVGVQTR